MDTWPLRRDRVLRLSYTLLERFDYEGVRVVLSAEAVHDAQCHAVLPHTHARLNLDFEGAARTLEPLAGEEPLATWRASTMNPRALQRVRDTAAAAAIRLTTADYSAFLTNCATFAEQARRHAILRTVGLWVDARITAPQIARYAGLERALSARHGSTGSWMAGSKVLDTVLRWWMDTAAAGSPHVSLVRQCLADLEKLAKVERKRHMLVHRAFGSGLADVERLLPDPHRAFPTVVTAVLRSLDALERPAGGPSAPLTSDVHGEIHEFIRRRIADWAPPEEELPPIGTAGDAAAI